MLIVLSTVQQRGDSIDDLRVERAVVLHPDFVTFRRDIKYWFMLT